MERDYTIAIDLGEGSVRVAAGYRDSSGRITIAAMNSQKSQGVKRGRIENIIEVTDAMSKAIASVEQKLNIKIQRAYCGISGEFVHTVQHDETIDILNIKSGVSNNDIKKLRELMSTVQASEGDMILDMSPLNYSVDAKSRVKNPLGALGKRIGACYNFILCEKDAYNRLKSTFEHSEIGIKQCFANFSVLGSSVVSKEEKEAGVAVVDLGQGVTNVAIYYKNALQYSISIPIGSSALDRDLTSLKISAQNVEDIKKKYGRAIAEGAELTTMNLQGRTSREFVEVPLVNIATVLEERMTDIVKFVENEIANAGFTELLHGIVLCGGGSNLAQVDKLFSRHLCETIRIATNIYISKQSPVRNAVNPEFATLMGIMNQGVMRDERGVGEPCTAPNMEYEDNVGHESAGDNSSERAA